MDASQTAPETNLPGVPAGIPVAAPVAAGSPPAPLAGLASPETPVKPRFGGNVGRKLRYDGLKSGSPEALAADRAADARRKREDRAAKAAAQPPAPLPGTDTPMAAAATDGFSASPGIDGFAVLDPVVNWTAEDFRQAAPELVELAEAWRIDTRTRQAVAGKLPRRVVEEIAKDVAFPPGSKKSLSTSSPVTLAKMFNALKVPVAFKAVVTAAPALVYIIVRDLQQGARIEKLIAANAEAERSAATEKK